MKKKITIEILVSIFFTISIFLFFYITKFYPTGNDIYGHLYKTQFLTNEIKNGNFYPLYSKDWYNGIQLFRYWPILTYYVMSMFQIFTNNVIITYYCFIAFTFFISFIGWSCIANRENRYSFLIIGIIYWFLPDNIRLFFGEGNLSRVFVMALLPLFFYFFTNLLEYKKSFIPTIILIVSITFTHFMIGAMCAIIFTIYSFFYGLKNHTWYLGLICFIIGFLISGIVLVPGVSGGLISDSSSAVSSTLSNWSQSLLKSLSFTNRYETVCTFGLSILIITIINIIFNKRKLGSIIGLIFFCLTSSIFNKFFIQLPLSQVWWMTRFIQMCYILIFYEFGFLSFDKKYKKIILYIFIILDIIPSLFYFTTKENPLKEDYLLDEAIENTNSRLGIVDNSTLGSFPSYYLPKNNVDFVQGWAIQGATTKSNVVNFTESMKFGFYNYSFKNLLELGCDTIIVKKDLLHNFNENEFFKSASYYGYELINETNDVFLFDNIKINSTYGITLKHKNLAIGSSSLYVCYLYSSFEQGYSDCIDDYSYETLKNYDKIYLSNFKYKNKENLENLLLKLSNDGVKIYIDSTHLPINNLTISELFGVETRFISLYQLNDLNYDNNTYKVELPYEWYTTYLTSNNTNVKLYSYKYGTQEISYLASLDNIKIIGFNLVYLYIENHNENLYYLLNDIFKEDIDSNLPKYEITPIKIKYQKNRIEINSNKDCLTSIAYQDNFNGNIKNYNNLIEINKGTTIINMTYKDFMIGIISSIIGIILMIVFYLKLKYIDSKLLEV